MQAGRAPTIDIMSIALPLIAPDGPGAAAVVGSHLATIDRAIAVVSRRRHLATGEARELASDVYLKLLQDDAAALRSFRGDSRLLTFLVIVVERVLLDARIARDGKWRPSASARRLGAVAIALERLVFHDGLRLQEAASVLRATHGIEDTDDELHFLLSLLPVRLRRRMVGDAELDRLSASDDPADTAIARETDGARNAAVQCALGALAPEDRRLVELRYDAGLPLSQIARCCGIDERVIYRRFHRVICGLRAVLRQPPPMRHTSSRAPRPAPARRSARRQ
jgi:RNA polymerase sigma factor (sigma-70 family)